MKEYLQILKEQVSQSIHGKIALFESMNSFGKNIKFLRVK